MESVIFRMPKSIASLTNELITIFIERVGAPNVYLATKCNLKQFFMAVLSAQNTQAQTWLADGDTVVVVDLGLEAGVRIGANEKIHIEIEGITTAEQWDVYATEGRENTSTHIKLDYKSMLVGEKDKRFEVRDEAIAVLKVTADLNEVGIVRGTQEVRFTPFELQALQVEDNPVLQYTAAGIDQMDIDFIVLPLMGIDAIRLYKEETGTVSFVTLAYADILPANARVVSLKR